MTIKEDVLRMFAEGEGLTPEAIADATGVPLVSVTTILLRAGKELPPGSQLDRRFGKVELGPELRRSVVEDYQAWVKQAETLRRLGITRTQYWNILNEEGIPTRKWKAVVDEARLRRDAEVVDLYLQGVPVLEICKLCGIKQGLLCHLLKKYDVPRRQIQWNTPKGAGESFTHPRELLNSYE